MKIFYEEGKIDDKWVDQYCKGDYERCVRHQKEKNGEPHSDNMLPNGEIKEDLK